MAEFLDDVLHDEIHDVEIRQLTIGAGSAVADAVLSRFSRAGRALVVAVRDTDGHYVTNPPPDTLFSAGDALIALGSEAQLRVLAAAAGERTERPCPRLA